MMADDKRYNFLIWIIGMIFTTFIAIGSVQLVSIGKMKNQLEDTIILLNFMSKDYVPLWYLEGMQKNMNYQTEEIVATINGNKAKVQEINIKYLEFQRTMLNNFIQMRGGITNITRSASANNVDSLFNSK